jgi:hypothetical protein
MILSEGDEDVSLETWAGVLEWFGPMDGVAILDRVITSECAVTESLKDLSNMQEEVFLWTSFYKCSRAVPCHRYVTQT